MVQINDKRIYIGLGILLVVLFVFYIFNNNKISMTTEEVFISNPEFYSQEYGMEMELIMQNRDNLSVCDNLSLVSLKELCYNKLGNCEDDECNLQTALFFNNENLCENIKNKDKKIWCKANVMYATTINLAIIEWNISRCDLLISEMRTTCIDTYNFRYGSEFKDLESCNKVLNPKLKEMCLSEN